MMTPMVLVCWVRNERLVRWARNRVGGRQQGRVGG